MENNDNLDGLSNALKAMEAMNKLANPWKGTTLESILETQKRLKEIKNPFENSFMQKIVEVSQSLSKIEEIGINFRNLNAHNVFRINHKYPLTSSQRIQSIFANTRLVPIEGSYSKNAFLLNGTIINEDILEKLNATSVFKHIELYENYEDEDPIVAEPIEKPNSIIKLDDTIRVQKLIKSVYDDNQQLYTVDPFDFERIIAELLRSRGFLVELTKKTRDGGKDIIALHETSGLGVNRYLIECKRWNKNAAIGVDVIRSLCFTVNEEKANKGIIFASSYFTKDAYKLKEQQKSLLEFRDGMAILEWISEYLKVNVF